MGAGLNEPEPDNTNAAGEPPHSSPQNWRWRPAGVATTSAVVTSAVRLLRAMGGLSSDAMLNGRVEAVRPPVAGDNAREYPVGDIVPGDGRGARCNLALREGLVA